MPGVINPICVRRKRQTKGRAMDFDKSDIQRWVWAIAIGIGLMLLFFGPNFMK